MITMSKSERKLMTSLLAGGRTRVLHWVGRLHCSARGLKYNERVVEEGRWWRRVVQFASPPRSRSLDIPIFKTGRDNRLICLPLFYPPRLNLDLHSASTFPSLSFVQLVQSLSFSSFVESFEAMKELVRYSPTGFSNCVIVLLLWRISPREFTPALWNRWRNQCRSNIDSEN